MFRLFYFLIAVVIAAPVNAEEVVSGKYRCAYTGDWGCGPGPEPICVDAVLRGLDAKLHLDLDARRIRLEGLYGRLERQNLDRGYYVYWQLGGLGMQRLEVSHDEQGVSASLIDESRPGHGSSHSDFVCKSAC